jgi:hypothetical protein
VALFTTDARYRAHPLRPAHTGHDGAGAYWARATADQSDVRVRFRDPHLGRDGVLAYTRRAYATETGQDPRFGTPVASGASAAVEW